MDAAMESADWKGFKARRRESAEARQAARHRHGDLHRALRRRISRDRLDRVQGRPRRSGDGQSGIRHRPGHRRTSSSCPTGSASMPTGSMSSMATATARRAASPAARARCPSAARRCMRRRSRSSTRASRSPRTCWKPPRSTSSSATAQFRIVGTDRQVDLFEVAKAAQDPGEASARHGAGPRHHAGAEPGRRDLPERLPHRRGRDRSRTAA